MDLYKNNAGLDDGQRCTGSEGNVVCSKRRADFQSDIKAYQQRDEYDCQSKSIAYQYPSAVVVRIHNS